PLSSVHPTPRVHPLLSALRLISRPLLFFFNAPPTTETSPLSLHDALPFSPQLLDRYNLVPQGISAEMIADKWEIPRSELDEIGRSEEHTSELQSLTNLVCRLLLEKKKRKTTRHTSRPHACSIAVVRPPADT